MKRFIRTLLAVLTLMSVACFAHATDVPISPTGPVWKFTAPGGPGALTWGATGPGGMNNSFTFAPYFTQENVCVYVYNNNTTSNHPFTGAILVSGDPTYNSSGITFQQAFTSSTLLAGASIANPAQFSAPTSGVAQISVAFSNSTTLAGSPDTASVVIVQTQGTCFAGNGSNASNPYPSVSLSLLQEWSDAFAQSYSYTATTTNGLSGQLISGIVNQAGGGVFRTLYFDRVTIVSTVASTVNVNLTSSLGTACAAGTAPVNLKLGQPNGSQGTTIIGACTNPAVTQAMFSNVAVSSTPVTLDLKGIIVPAGSNAGIDIVLASADTGIITVTWFETEK